MKKAGLLVLVSLLFVVSAVTMNTMTHGIQTADYYAGSVDGESAVLTPFFQSVTDRVDSENWKVSFRECLAVPHQVRYEQKGYPFVVKEKMAIDSCGPVYETTADTNSLGANSLLALLGSTGAGFVIYSSQRFIKKRP